LSLRPVKLDVVKLGEKNMGSLGMQEIIVIFVIALIVFGPRKLPEIGKSLGKGLAEFKKASNELQRTWEEDVRLEKEKEIKPEIQASAGEPNKVS
jgi:sec-independent protein translocase protein TatA